MKTVSLSGSLRANVGKVDATAVRAKGHVPCVIYGAGEQIHFSTDIRNFKNIIFTPETSLVEIDVDGKKYKTVLQETQYHKINDKLIHADFLMVSEDKPVSVQLPVKAVGQSEGVKAGGKLNVKLRKLKVKGLISKLPESIDLSIDKLGIGKSISVGITVLHPKNISVISVDTTRAVVAEEPAKAANTAAPAKAAAAPAKAAAPKK
jgi:large subunit ribosomal protein L25